MRHFLYIFTALLLAACSTNRAPQSWAERLASDGPAPDSITFSYARLLHVEQCDGYRVAYVDNPWKAGKGLHTYVLVPRDTPLPHNLPGGTIVRTPLKRSVIFTSVHCALAAMLHAESQVAGVADLKYIKVPFVSQDVAQGAIADCGDGMSPLIEKIIDSDADAILLSPFENSGGYGRVEDIGIPLIECAEYMEASPLARAEWMRFYGMLYGEEQRADSLFGEVKRHYKELCTLATTAQEQPTVVLDKMAGNVWYVPGGHSTIGQMLSDAACSYPWASDNSAGSLQLPMETVLERAGDCLLWLLRYDAPEPLTMERLLSEQDCYRMMRATQGDNVWACNVSTSMFYEETPFRPDMLLQDFITILHPELMPTVQPRYYFKVK